MSDYVRKDFTKKANACLADFNNISSQVLHELIEKYCYSFYGINLCSFDDPAMNAIFVEWRKTMRRVWRLPPRAHSRLLPHISHSLPPNVCIYQRFVNFFYSGLLSDNATVSSMFQMSLYNPSRMGNNIQYVFELAGCDFNNIYTVGSRVVRQSLLDKWSGSFCEDDVSKATQIRELISERDCMNDWILNYDECQYLITVLCTE